jgi:hypothetical protein
MATNVRIFTRLGVPLADFECQCTWGDILNDRSTAKISLPKSDPKITEEVLRYRNLVFIEHDTAGKWGGVLEHPQPWSDSTIELTAYTPDKILEFRNAYSTSYTGTAGAIFQQLLSDANREEATGIVFAEASSSGSSWTEPAADGNLYQILKRVADRSGQEWVFDPYITATGRLSFSARWLERRGSALSFTLEEGSNIRAAENKPMMILQSKVVNRWYVRATRSGTVDTATVNDATSQALYGLCENTAIVTLPVGITAATYGALLLATSAAPRRTFKPVALDVNDTFAAMQIGNTVKLKLLNYGFSDGGFGLEMTVRLIAKEWDEYSGQMMITIDEVF